MRVQILPAASLPLGTSFAACLNCLFLVDCNFWHGLCSFNGQGTCVLRPFWYQKVLACLPQKAGGQKGKSMQLLRRGLQGLALAGFMWLSTAAHAQLPSLLITVDENGSGTASVN